MDTLALLHPSLGLAFTAEFKTRSDMIEGNVGLDGLPCGCHGCKETLSGELICCQEIGHVE